MSKLGEIGKMRSYLIPRTPPTKKSVLTLYLQKRSYFIPIHPLIAFAIYAVLPSG